LRAQAPLPDGVGGVETGAQCARQSPLDGTSKERMSCAKLFGDERQTTRDSRGTLLLGSQRLESNESSIESTPKGMT
jgi:hypothetical protein